MPFTNFYDTAILQQALGSATFTVPATTYLGLSTTTPAQAKGSSGAPWNFTEPALQGSLSSASGTSAGYVAVPLAAMGSAVTSGDSLKYTSGGNNQTFTSTASVAAGGTSIAITSATPNFNYPIGTLVQDVTQENGYARLAITNNTTNFTAVGSEPSAGYEEQNGIVLTMPTSTGAWAADAQLTYFGLFDAAGGGDLLLYGALSPNEQVGASGITLSFAIGALTVTQN